MDNSSPGNDIEISGNDLREACSRLLNGSTISLDQHPSMVVILSGNNSYLNLSKIALMISLIMMRMIDRMNRPIIAINTISRLSNIIGLVKV